MINGSARYIFAFRTSRSAKFTRSQHSTTQQIHNITTLSTQLYTPEALTRLSAYIKVYFSIYF